MMSKVNLLAILLAITMLLPVHILPTNSSTGHEVVKPSLEYECNPENSTFTSGEKLVYKVYYNWGFIWLSAGELVMKVAEKEDKYIITARGYTYDSYSWLFEVDDYFETHIDKYSLKPLFSKKRLQEDDYRLYEELTYDWENLQVNGKRGNTADDIEYYTEEISACSHDLISVLYGLRVKDYDNVSTGHETPVQVYLNKDNYNVDLIFEENTREDISKLGEYQVRKFYTNMKSGTTFGDEGARLDVLVSNDANKIPLYIESELSVGAAKVILSEASGLKYEFSSKLSGE